MIIAPSPASFHQRHVFVELWDGITSSVRRRCRIGGASPVFAFAVVVLTVIRAGKRHRDLVAEHLLRRHQLVVLTRPTRRRRVRVGSLDRLLWAFTRRQCRDWRRHLVVITPETVIRWHRAG
jgi:hypothetical protein